MRNDTAMREETGTALQREVSTRQPPRRDPPCEDDSAVRGQVLCLLEVALAAECASRRRYARHSECATHAEEYDLAVEFSQHAAEKQRHMQRLAQRIQELGGNAEQADRPAAARPEPPLADAGLADLLREDIVAECLMLDTCLETLRKVGESDPVSREILDDLVVVGEARVIRLIRLLRDQESARRFEARLGHSNGMQLRREPA